MSQTHDVPRPTGRTVQANGLNIYYEEYGSGSPMILLHGSFDCTGAMWAAQIPWFAKAFRVLVPDARGHGRTDNPADQITLDLLAEDVAAFSRALRLEKPVLCGLSMGGRTALKAGMRTPDLFRALIVAAAQAHRPFPQAVRDGWRAIGIKGPGDVDPGLLEAADPARVARLRTLHIRSNDQWKILLRQLSYVWSSERHSLEDYRTITIPTLVVVGDRDEVVRLEDVVDMYRQLPAAELAVLPGHDHCSPVGTRDQSFSSVVLDFLRRHRE